MKRSDAILVLAKEIAELQARKASLDGELRQLNDHLKVKTAKFRALVPDGDDQVDDAVLTSTPEAAGTASLIELIPSLMAREPDKKWTVEEVYSLCPSGTKISTIRSSMSRLKQRGKIAKADHGRYMLPSGPTLAALSSQASSAASAASFSTAEADGADGGPAEERPQAEIPLEPEQGGDDDDVPF